MSIEVTAMAKIFSFGESVKGFKVPVLNEREVRAAAGILFAFAFFSFMNAVLIGNFSFIRIFVVIFAADFIIRMFVSPRFAPSLIIGRFFVSKQKPEYVGAPQKRFAWGIGLVLSVFMAIFFMMGGSCGPAVGIICMLCLVFLFFESVFGICIGCWMYNMFNKEKAQLCPGGACEVRFKEDIQKITTAQIIVLLLFAALFFFISRYFDFGFGGCLI